MATPRSYTISESSGSNLSASQGGEQIKTKELRLSAIVEDISHWLPTQGPIKDFIHHNTLHAYQEYPFHEGVRRATRMTGARGYLTIDEFRRRFQDGEIRPEALDRAIGSRYSLPSEQERIRNLLLFETNLVDRPTSLLLHEGLRSRWKARWELDMSSLTHPIIFRLAANFLDQGIAVWRMPDADLSLFDAVAKIADSSWLPFFPFQHREAKRLLALGAEAAALEVLGEFLFSESHYRRYLMELCAEHPGWSGMIRMIEVAPGSLNVRRKARLLDFIALELIAERVLAFQHGLPRTGLITHEQDADEDWSKLPAELTEVVPTQTESLLEIWQEAFEASYSDALVHALREHALGASVDSPSARSEPAIQAFFCIDDRECSIRRHLEEIDPEIETFGTAGFFGIDCVFQGVTDAMPFKHCPVPVNPRHLIREKKKSDSKQEKKKNGLALHLQADSNTLFRGFLLTQILGVGAAVRLAMSLLRPSVSAASMSSLSRVDQDAELEVARTQDALSEEGYLIGYSPEEMADRVYQLLLATGAAGRPLSRLVVLLGHGASSVNNPYFSAYDCGACSGKAGAPNSRAFAVMANHPRVREILAQKGIRFPSLCWFVGGLHDTTRDEADFYDLDLLPEGLRDDWKRFRAQIHRALRRNAQERCRRFAMVPMNIRERVALKEVFQRSTAIFEPRPELNHATNAACIVGRRALTRGLFLDRRSFLNSYDYRLDTKGELLAGILGAVVPVCGGINLEYYFSRVDSKKYGADSKLPHNVVGLIGVINGTEGDLLTGLPTQMTEVHDPIRLSIVVEQSPQLALAAAKKNPQVLEWIHNDWVRYFCLDPIDKSIWIYSSGVMKPYEVFSKGLIPVISESAMAFSESRKNIEPKEIREQTPQPGVAKEVRS